MKLLHLDSSIRRQDSVSRELSSAIVDRVRSENPSCTMTYHDLDQDPVPYLSGAVLTGQVPELPEPGLVSGAVANQSAMEEFMEADLLVIGAPMYNFTVPSQLKSWFDRIAIAGQTFRYTEAGPEGLMGHKRAIIVSTRGNIYSGNAPAAPFDHQEPWLLAILGFMGMTDVQIVRAEGIAFSPQHHQDAVRAAHEQIGTLRL